MAGARNPAIGRPFGNAITENQLLDLFRSADKFRNIKAAWPLNVTNTPGGGLRMHIDPRAFPSGGVASVVAVLGRAVVVGNDQVEPAITDGSEFLAVRSLADASPYNGTMIAGEAEQVRTWWPKRNSDYAAVRYSAPIETGGELSAAAGVTAVLLVSIDGVVVAFLVEAGGGKAQQYKITATPMSDYMICREVIGEEVGPADVYVAKPWMLRGADTWNLRIRQNIAYSQYSADHNTRYAKYSGVVSGRTQRLTPGYYVEDIVTAIEADTGVTIPGEPSPIPVTLLDVNVDGRMWANT